MDDDFNLDDIDLEFTINKKDNINNELQIFNNKRFGQIRMIKINNKPYAVAKDIAVALGYKNTNDAINKHCRGVVKRDLPHPQNINKTIKLSVIPQGDIIRLAVKCPLEGADKFESWIFDEVIPSVLNNGMYATDELLNNPDLLIKIAIKLKQEKEEKEKLIKTNNCLVIANTQKDKKIKELEPDAKYANEVLNSKDLLTITQIAKDFGCAAPTFNKLLESFGIQYQRSSQWLLTCKYQDKGYTQSVSHPFNHTDGTPGSSPRTKWTETGKRFIHNFLALKGIYPTTVKQHP